MPIQVNVRDSRELQAAVLAIASVPKDVKAQIRKQTKAMAQPEWQAGLASRAKSKLDQKVLVKTARVQVRDTNVVLRSGATGSLKDLTRPVEFGSDRDQWHEYQSSRHGTHFKVRRHTARQMGWRRKEGRVVYPTANDLIPRFASLWVQTVIRTFHETWERR